MLTSALRCTPVLTVDGRPVGTDDRLLELGRSVLGRDGLGAAVS
jgi:hypothetical protein